MRIVQHSNGTIEVSQKEAVLNVTTSELPRHRRRQPDSPLIPAEVSERRRVIGQLSWVARQTRPDLAIYASVAAQSMGNPTVQTLLDANRAVQKAHED